MSKILIADDDPFLIKIYSTRFTQDGHDVIACTDGESALRQTIEEQPDLVVLDIMLPRLSGLDVLTALQEDKKTKSIPVVFMSNLSQEEEQKEAKDRGATDFLVKAKYTPSQVIEALQKYLKPVKKDTSSAEDQK